MDARQGLRIAAGAAAGITVLVVARATRAAVTKVADAVLPLPEGDGSRPRGARDRAYQRGVTINRPPAEVYRFWRDLQPLARVLDRVARVEWLDDRRSRWVVEGPGPTMIEFTAEITDDEPDRALSWRSLDSPVPHEGRVEFESAPGRRGTELRVRLAYRPPAGAVGVAVARFTGDEPDLLVRDALRRVKQVLECGEAIRVDGQPSGRGPLQERVTEIVRHRVATGGRA
jgi:uncharacterized membrane protein